MICINVANNLSKHTGSQGVKYGVNITAPMRMCLTVVTSGYQDDRDSSTWPKVTLHGGLFHNLDDRGRTKSLSSPALITVAIAALFRDVLSTKTCV
jgi:hypothetical protein